MTRTDWLAGIRHAYHLDRAELGAFAAYQAVLGVVTVIVGAPIWVPVALVCAAIVPAITSTARRARAARDSREFYEWMLDNTDHTDWESTDAE